MYSLSIQPTLTISEPLPTARTNEHNTTFFLYICLNICLPGFAYPATNETTKIVQTITIQLYCRHHDEICLFDLFHITYSLFPVQIQVTSDGLPKRVTLRAYGRVWRLSQFLGSTAGMLVYSDSPFIFWNQGLSSKLCESKRKISHQRGLRQRSLDIFHKVAL